MALLLQQLYNSLALGSIYLLTAAGITLIYGLTRLVNFAHGEMLVLGAFISYLLVKDHWPFYAAALASMVIVGLVGELADLAVFRRTLGSPLRGFMVSIGLIAVFEGAYALHFGNNFYSINPPLNGIWDVSGVHIDQARLLIVVIAIVVCAALFLILQRTDWGRAIRALAENAPAARTLGVPVGRLISATFIVGSGLAALGGALFATVFPFTAYSGSTFILKGFAVAIIGGLGNIGGAVVAALLLALAENLGAGYISFEWVSAFGLVLMAAILIVRPTGLFRGTESGSEEAFGANWAAPRSGVSRRETLPVLLRPLTSSLTLVFAAVVVIPWLLPTARSLSIATGAVVTAVIAFSLWMTFHHAGIFSIVQGALMGAGAYASAVLSHQVGLGFWAELPCAVTAAALVAFFMGVISLRSTASYFLILTFALAELVIAILTNWQSMTGGPLGLVVTGPPGSVGPFDFHHPKQFYYLAAAGLLLTVVIVVVVGRSAFGQRLHTIRDNERLARSVGLNTYFHKLAIFVIAGAVAGVGGWLYLYQQLYIEPSQFDALAGINIALVVILGGISSPAGPIVGAFVVAFLPEFLHLGPNQSHIAYGVLLVALVLLLPGGIMGGIPGWRRLLRRTIERRTEAQSANAL